MRIEKSKSSSVAALAVALVLGVLALALPVAAQDPVTVGPTVYKSLLDNAHVRVFEVRFARGAEIASHSHPDHTVYVVKGGTLRITEEGGKPADFELKPGQSLFLPAQTHAAKNVGKSEIMLVVTDLKDAGAMTATLSAFDRAELVEMLERSREQTETLVARAVGDAFTQKPGPDRWSVAEILEHLAAAESLLFGMAQGGMAGAEDPEWRSLAASRDVAQIFTMLTDRSQKFQAPEPIRPKGGKTRAELVGEYASNREVTLDFARTTDAALKSRSVVTPGGKMTVHQFLVFLAGHNVRHNAQMAEALAQIGVK